MEQTEEYKKVKARIEALEQQLAQCGISSQEAQHFICEAETVIEDHFARCMNALAARKMILLKEVEKVANQCQNNQDTQTKLEAAIKTYKKTLKGAALVYAIRKESTETILKELTKMPMPHVSISKPVLRLPLSLIEAIHVHGEVSAQCSQQSTSTIASVLVDLVTTIAGSKEGKLDGGGLDAKFNRPQGICLNPQDKCFYIADTKNNLIRKLSLQGSVSTFVGVPNPSGIVMNHKENAFYVTSFAEHKIIKISSSGAANVFAGSGNQGHADGVGTQAMFHYPHGIAIDQNTGTLFVSDYGSDLIRKITVQGVVSTLAGSSKGFSDGHGHDAKFQSPCGLFYDAEDGSLIVCDNQNNRLRRVQLNGDVSTLCHVPYPRYVALTENKTIIVTSGDGKLYKVTHQVGAQKLVAEVLAGNGKEESVDGNALECSFKWPRGIALDESTNSCYVADTGNNSIRKVSFTNNA